MSSTTPTNSTSNSFLVKTPTEGPDKNKNQKSDDYPQYNHDISVLVFPQALGVCDALGGHKSALWRQNQA